MHQDDDAKPVFNDLIGKRDGHGLFAFQARDAFVTQLMHGRQVVFIHVRSGRQAQAVSEKPFRDAVDICGGAGKNRLCVHGLP